MGRPNGGDGRWRWRWRWRCKEPVVFLPCCSFRRCRCRQPNLRSNRGRFSGDPHLPSSKPGTPAGLPGETARTCPGSRLSLQSPVSTPHGWLVVGRACLPTPDVLSRAMPEGARATAGGEGKAGGGKAATREASTRGEVAWMEIRLGGGAGMDALQPFLSRLVALQSCRLPESTISCPFSSTSPGSGVLILYSLHQDPATTHYLHLLRPSRPLTQRPSDRRNPETRHPSPVSERPGRHSLPLPCAVSSPVQSRLPTPRLCVHCAAAATPTNCGFPGSEPARFFRFPSHPAMNDGPIVAPSTRPT